jgi:hypothetical protein
MTGRTARVTLSEAPDGGLDRGTRAGWVSDVQGDHQQVLVSAERLADPLRVPPGGYNGVPGGEG